LLVSSIRYWIEEASYSMNLGGYTVLSETVKDRNAYTAYMDRDNQFKTWQEFILTIKERKIVIKQSLFECAMDSLEEASLNIPMEQVSNDYYDSDIAAKQCEDELRAALPPHLHCILSRLADKSVEREAASMTISYRQGFSDSMQFIMQALSWEPSRR
jgi:hypothetical protein